MAVFLVDNDKTYTYEDLFCSLNHAIEYCPLLKTRDVYVYFVNLIRALTANRPLVLLDSDLNPSEIDGVDENEVNQTKVIEQKSFASTMWWLRFSSLHQRSPSSPQELLVSLRRWCIPLTP